MESCAKENLLTLQSVTLRYLVVSNQNGHDGVSVARHVALVSEKDAVTPQPESNVTHSVKKLRRATCHLVDYSVEIGLLGPCVRASAAGEKGTDLDKIMVNKLMQDV